MMRRSIVLMVLFALAAGAQQPQQPFTLRVDTQLVVQTVVVRDRDGKPMEGLTAKDFVVTEDNVPQTISVFEFQKFEEAPKPAPAATPAPTTPPAPTVQPLIEKQITPPAPGDARYQNRRLLTLFFDMANTPPADQFRAFDAAVKFLDKQMAPADLISIMVYSSGVVRVLQDFTDDRGKLYETLSTLMYPDEEDIAELQTGGAFGQNGGEFNLFNTDRQLAALQTAVNMLRGLNEQKSLVYFSSGLRLNGTDNQAQLRATINAAIRANVAFYPVDARGLVAMAPLGDAARPSPGGAGVYTGSTAMAMMAGFQRSQDTLYALASDTGGKAMLDNNDLVAGIVQAQQAITSYYIIGYYPTNKNLDGKFRRVKISLIEFPNAKLDYRQGYFGGKVFSKFTAADKERQLEEALMLGDPIT
ncbi:MAG: VWA domain-containing protein, partial [Acidobacteria bacterium]|nr:VWA domain-containing protein [Acidobacteriota bacterium]